MNTIHRTTISGRCPHGGQDIYAAEFHVEGGILTVETIQAAIEELTREPAYQEALTQALADRLGCTVVTAGAHGKFQTTCRVGPLP